MCVLIPGQICIEFGMHAMYLHENHRAIVAMHMVVGFQSQARCSRKFGRQEKQQTFSGRTVAKTPSNICKPARPSKMQESSQVPRQLDGSSDFDRVSQAI